MTEAAKLQVSARRTGYYCTILRVSLIGLDGKGIKKIAGVAILRHSYPASTSLAESWQDGRHQVLHTVWYWFYQ